MNNKNFVTCVAETFPRTVITFWYCTLSLTKVFLKIHNSLFNIFLSTNQIILDHCAFS